jgi:hypothetical protein
MQGWENIGPLVQDTLCSRAIINIEMNPEEMKPIYLLCWRIAADVRG